MPKPVYIICAEGIVQDKRTSLVSIFKVTEQVTLELGDVPAPDAQGRGLIAGDKFGFEAVSVWRKEGGDEGKEFIHEFEVKGSSAKPHSVPFAFSEDKHLQRFSLIVRGLPLQKTGSSIVFVESRVKEVGSEVWQSQSFPIFVEVKDMRTAPADDDKQAAHS